MDNCPQTPSIAQVGPGGSQCVPDPPGVGSTRVGPVTVGLGSEDPTEGPTQGPTQPPTTPTQKTQVGPGGWDPPALWPGFDPSRRSPYGDAWRDVWSRLNDSWTPMPEIVAAVATAHDLQTKTVSGMIREAGNNGHLIIRGRYSRKSDTRMIRRNPQAAA